MTFHAIKIYKDNTFQDYKLFKSYYESFKSATTHLHYMSEINQIDPRLIDIMEVDEDDEVLENLVFISNKEFKMLRKYMK